MNVLDWGTSFVSLRFEKAEREGRRIIYGEKAFALLGFKHKQTIGLAAVGIPT